MDFNSFCSMVCEKLGMEKYEVNEVKKINGFVEQVMFFPKKDSEYYGDARPVFYKKEMEEMLRLKNPESCLQWVTEQFERAQKTMNGINIIEALNRKNITMRLVNTKSNQTLLREVPHHQFHDLSVIYYVDMSELEEGASVGIKYSNMEKIFPGMTEEDLFRQALDNEKTSEHNPLTCQSMMEVLVEMGCPTAVLEDMKSVEMAEGVPMQYVLSKKGKTFGASVVLHEDMLKSLSEKVGAPLWLLPSSVHEWLAMPVTGAEDPNSLMEMIHEVNMTQVSPEDRLSNHLYRYDEENGVTMIPLEEGMDSDILCDCLSQAVC